jgi:hypothetical protein
MLLLAYTIATLLIVFLFFLSCKMSLALDTKRTFKRSRPVPKRARGSVFCSPKLQDAIFAKNEKYAAFWATEVEIDSSMDY